eukprot:NODE_838_length_3795_cov_0.380952.p1 type:complete len:293 gc:universal NODE_838_length_3795_cov_0.380952:3606-2728(-)
MSKGHIENWLKTFENLRLPPWTDDESFESHVKVIKKMAEIDEVDERFSHFQFFIAIYMDNKHENTMPLGLSQKDTFKEIGLYKIETSNKFNYKLGLSDEWHVDGRDSPSMRPLIQHYFVLKTVWNHANKSEKFSLAFLKEIHFNLMSGAYEKTFKDIKFSFPAGEIREVHVGAGNYQFMDPIRIPKELDDLIDRINAVSSLQQIMVCFREFLLIHPFVNGNGRTARLLLNWMLCRLGICKFPIVLATGRKKSRNHYIASLKKYDQGIKAHLQFLLLCSFGELGGNYLALHSK